jgi:hypothetical protein
MFRPDAAGNTSPEGVVQPSAWSSTVCDLLQPFGSMPASVARNTTTLFDQICVLPQFDSLIWTWGQVTNFTVNGTTYPLAANLSISWSGTVASGWVTANFAVDWVSSCEGYAVVPSVPADSLCSFQEYWTGYLANNTLVGPAFVVHPASTSSEVPIGTSPLQSMNGAPVAILLAASAVGAGTGLVAWTLCRRTFP